MRRTILLITAACVGAVWTFRPRQALPHEIESTTTTVFDREIVRILNKHCVACHAEKSLSFPLTSYEETWFRARSIKAAALRRHMPPWRAISGYGQFMNDNGLTSREVEFIVSWVDGGGPRNAGTVFLNVQDSGPVGGRKVRAQADFEAWQLGESSLTRQIAATTIEPGQANHVRRSVVDPGLTAERWVRGLEYRPGDRRVVRAASFTVQETGQWLGSWTPWYGVVNLPEGTAYRLPAGSHIVAEIHYRGAKEPVVEQGTLGLFEADRPGPTRVSDLVLEATSEVASGVAAQRFNARATLATDTYALAMRPDIQPGMTSIEVSARRPDGGTEILLFAKDLVTDWPTPYIFKEPMLLRKGTELSVTAYCDAGAPVPKAIRLTVSRYDKD